ASGAPRELGGDVQPRFRRRQAHALVPRTRRKNIPAEPLDQGPIARCGRAARRRRRRRGNECNQRIKDGMTMHWTYSIYVSTMPGSVLTPPRREDERRRPQRRRRAAWT